MALVQSSLLLLISAATTDPPAGLSAAEQMAISDNLTAAVAVLGIVLGIAAFLAGFIISSTFAFTVAQRRRDLALLRLVGGGRGQVRRMLLGEALLLGGLGAAAGVPAGLGVMRLQAWLMRRFGFVPAGLRGPVAVRGSSASRSAPASCSRWPGCWSPPGGPRRCARWRRCARPATRPG